MVVPNGRAEIIAPTDTRPQYLRYRVNIFAGKGCSRPEAGIYAAHLLEQEATKGKIGTMQSTGRDEATGQELRGLVPLVDGYRRIARIEKQNSSPDYADIGMLGERGGNLLDIIWCEIAIVIGQAHDPTLRLAPAAVTRSAEPDAGLTDDPCII